MLPDRQHGLHMKRCAFALGIAASLIGGCAQSNRGASAGERDTPVGVEVHWLVVEARPAGGDPLGDVLKPYADDLIPGDARVVDAWKQNGLRIVSVPKDEVDAIRARLTLVGPAQEQWFGQVPRWTQVVRGPEFEHAFGIGLDNGMLRLSPGALRILGRAWVAPLELAPREDASDRGSPRAGLRVELLPQHEEREQRKNTWIETGAPASKDRQSPIDAGLVFSRLTWSATLTGERAIIILPQVPDEAWSTPATDPDAAVELGPAYRPPTTLGETMLASEGGSRRIVVIIVPSTPEKYELLR